MVDEGKTVYKDIREVIESSFSKNDPPHEKKSGYGPANPKVLNSTHTNCLPRLLADARLDKAS